jgi:hypothetical protein
VFNLKFISGSESTVQLKYQSMGVDSKPTRSIRLKNHIVKVELMAGLQ